MLTELGPAQASPIERDGFRASRLPAEILAMAPQVAPRPSAVVVPLYDRDGEAWVILTRRGMAMRAHAGEVSFPGGRVEAGDVDLVHTALREAEEEVGLDPAAIEIVGELDHLATITSGSFIVPWVGVLAHPPSVKPCSPEVDAVLEVPLSELLSPGVFHEELWDFGTVSRPLVFFDLVGDTVWGATASMLRQLLGFLTGTVARGESGHD